MTQRIHRTWQPIIQIRETWTDEWIPAPHLKPQLTTTGVWPTIDSTSFEWAYGNILPAGQNAWQVVEPLPDGLAGWFVQLLWPSATGDDGDIPLWTGVFANTTDSVGGDHATTTGTGSQMLIAWGLARLLADAPVDGSYIWSGGLVKKIDTVQPFNVRHRVGNALAGNRSADVHDGVYVFSDDGELWTAQNVIEYLMVHFASTRLPFLYPTADESPAMANLANSIDAWPAPRTVAQGLASVIDRRRGHVWKVALDADGDPIVEPYSMFATDVETEGFSLAANETSIDLNLADRDLVGDVQVRRSDDYRYDQLTVLGAHAWVCGAVPLTEAWVAAEETAYKAAAEPVRRQDRFAHVYTAFRVDVTAEKPFTDGTAALGCPSITDEGAVDWATAAPFFPFGRSLTRQTPLQVGWNYSGTAPSQRDVEAPLEFLPPAVYVKFTDPADEEEEIYAPVDGLADLVPGAPSIGVSVLDGELGIRLRVPFNHIMAANHWPGAAASPRSPVFDYDDLAATAAIRSDSRLKIVKTLAPGGAGGPRKLIIEVPDAELWLCRKGAIIGAVDDTLTRTTADMVLRDDSARLRAVAEMAAAWYGRPRRAVTLTYRAIEADVHPGYLLRTLTAVGADAMNVSSVVSRLTWDWTTASTTIETDFGELDFTSVGRRGHRRGSSAPRIGAAGHADAPREANLPVRAPAAPPPSGEIPGWITGAAVDSGTGLTTVWKYSWAETTQAAAGAGELSTLSGGRSGTSNAYNDDEEINPDATGTTHAVGIGAFPTDLNDGTTPTLGPVPTGTPAMFRPVVCADGTLIWRFSGNNTLKMECD